ncbi:hypothetical protein DS742_07425 [Lacrimispora amygdalina]|uniref:PPM-type phosphatase domain-containing protein n=1 Tax=Lacrimispora amygdalina TaxID=253257 RepID=A0A3E2NF21_9FIRM|nr:PP2C family serine/threonine-protein phosphatase [Clostridium indicum]RFZ79596.1 hypothetical protein DS742_07425 [Clostridium indicum]
MPYIILSSCILTALLIVRISLGSLNSIPKLDAGYAGTVGNQQVNADAYDWANYENQTLYVIAGGIGRSGKGKIAAQEAINTIVRMFEITGATKNPAFFFRQALHSANQAILKRITDSTAGASVLCAVVKEGFLYYASVGNCRISVYRHGELIPLSEGHTIDVLAKNAFRKGQISRMEALAALKEKRLYSFVGHDGFQDVEIYDVPVSLKRGDSIVMMTDGVYEFFSAGQMEKILQTRKNSAQKACQVMEELENNNHPEQGNASLIISQVNRI